jgi:hypothetical protein
MNEKNIWKMKKGRKVKYQLHIGARNFLLESNIESLKCNLQANTEFARSGEWQAKVTFSSVMIFLIVFSSFTVLAPKAQTVQVSGNENVIFQDDFESYAVGTFPSQGGWQIVYNGAGNQYIVVTNSCYYSPTKSFQTKGRSGWSCVVKRDFSSNSSVIGYEGCIMTTGTDASGSISFSNQYVVTWGRYYAGVGFSGGYIVSGSHVFAPISPGSWTKVRVVLDKNTRLYDVWINDTLSAENLVEPNDPNEILSLQVGTGWPSTPNYFDDVKVFSVSSLDASISPANATTSIGGTTNYGITVRNYADISDNVTLSISGLNPSWYSLSNDRLMMVPGETSTVQLNVTVPENPENAGFYPFNVIINGLSAQKVVGANLTVLLSPTVDSLEPQDGITIGSTDLLISWRTSVQASSEVYIKRADESTFTHVIGENGTDHFVHAYNLSRNADYSWCAYSATQYANVSSAFRTLHVSNGVSFSQYVYTFNVERDYAQYESVSVINNDTQSHDLLLQALNPYQDLIVGFVGAGSVDENVTLAPGETMSVDFNIFAQDAMQSTYVFEFKLTNLGPEQVVDYAEVNVNVRQPNINLEVVQTETDNATLAGTYVVTNHGDTVTDLRIAPDDQIKSQLQIQPVINHALLRSGESLQFEAVPMLTTNFTGLQGNIQVEASNVTENVPLNVTLPEGMSVFTVLRNNVTWTTSFHDWYCTNRPRIDEVFTLPSWIKKTVNGEPNVDNAALIIDFFLVWPLEDYRPHSVHLFMNGVEFGSLQNTIPASFFIFPLDN